MFSCISKKAHSCKDVLLHKWYYIHFNQMANTSHGVAYAGINSPSATINTMLLQLPPHKRHIFHFKVCTKHGGTHCCMMLILLNRTHQKCILQLMWITIEGINLPRLHNHFSWRQTLS